MPVKKILVVTPNPMVQDLANFAFEVVARWELLSARSLTEGLAKAHSHAPDAIVVDGSLGNAIRLAEQLRGHAATARIPVVILAQATREGTSRGKAESGLARVVGASGHPRKLAMDIAQTLGWQPQWMGAAWTRRREARDQKAS